MSCERYRAWSTDAAAGELPENRRTEWEAHLRECTVCRQEFHRVQTLLAAIDASVAAQVGEAPSPRLLAQVKQRIQEETPVARLWRARWVPAAAGAAALILAASVWTLRVRNGAPRVLLVHSATSEQPAPSAPSASNAISAIAHGKPLLASAHRGIVRRRQRMEREPEIIVLPGQMEAVMQFAQLLNSRKIDGAKLLADLKMIDQPLEIKPLVIAPLDVPKSANAGPNGGATEGVKKFVSLQDSR